MREIKFRAWNKLKKIMVYEDEDNSSVYLDGWCASDVQVLNQTLNSKFVKDRYEFMQYTGLKDKNGKEIYEGDIIQDEFYERKAEVVFLEGAFWLDYKKDFGVYNTKHNRYQLLANYDYEEVLEVIGNIYDNPELLEV